MNLRNTRVVREVDMFYFLKRPVSGANPFFFDMIILPKRTFVDYRFRPWLK